MGVLRRVVGRSGIKPLDPVFIAIVVALTVGTAIYAYNGKPGSIVSIRSFSSEWLYPVGSDITVSIAGPIGETIVRIEDRAVYVVDSACRDKICVRMGALERTGEWAACLPNGVMIQIVGDLGDGIDAVTY